jgi:hypothetical protein
MRHMVGARKACVQRSFCTASRKRRGSQCGRNTTLPPALMTGSVTLYQPMKAVDIMLHMASDGIMRHR